MPLCLPARVAGEQAARYFSRPRFWNLYGLLVRSVRVAVQGSPETRTLPFVERLWLPAYAVCLHTVSSKGERSMWTSVDGISGEFALFEGANELVPQESNEDCFAPKIDEAQAVDFSRKGLLRCVMARRGQFNKPLVDAVEEVRPYYFAIWVYYYRRRRKFIDIKVLDGYTGKSAGAKMRVSVVNAIVAKHKAGMLAEQ